MAAELLTDASRATDSNSNPYAGAQWFFYATGTLTPQSVYADAGLNTSLGSVVTADAGGKFVPIYFDGSKRYRGILKSADGSATIYDIDPINTAVMAEFASGTGAINIGFQQPDSGAVLRDLYEKAKESLWAADFDVDQTGAAESTSALAAAFVASATRRKTLYITGTPRVTSTVTIPAYARIVFDGAPGNFAGQQPASYIIKDASCSGPAILISGQSAEIHGGGVIGEAGNTGDNIQITNHSVTLFNVYSEGAEQDGIRIGKDASGSPNANRFKLFGCSAYGNGRDGLHIADNLTPDGAPNCNAGFVIGGMFQSNTRHGVYGGNSFGVSIRDSLIQSNDDVGVYLDRKSQGWLLSGGDFEHNKGGSSDVGSDLTIADTDIACTFTDTGDLVTSAGHGLVDDTPVRFWRVNTTTGINTTTTYWVVSATTDTFQVSASKGGSAVALTNNGTGVWYILNTHSTRGGHIIDGVHLGRLPYDGGFQTDQRWIIGQGFGASSGLRPSYSEGTWTPTLGGATTAGTHAGTVTGFFVKNGRQVTAYFDINVTSFSSATGALRIGNLPFSAVSGRPASISPGLISYLTMPSSRPGLGGAISGRNFDLYGFGSQSTTQFVAVDSAAQTGSFLTAGRISGTITYMTAD